MGGDEHAPVLQMHQAAVADHGDVLAGQPPPARYLAAAKLISPLAPTRRVLAAGAGAVGAAGAGSLSGAAAAVASTGSGAAKRKRSKGATMPIDW